MINERHIYEIIIQDFRCQSHQAVLEIGPKQGVPQQRRRQSILLNALRCLRDQEPGFLVIFAVNDVGTAFGM